jgi:hypothetical protein
VCHVEVVVSGCKMIHRDKIRREEEECIMCQYYVCLFSSFIINIDYNAAIKQGVQR